MIDSLKIGFCLKWIICGDFSTLNPVKPDIEDFVFNLFCFV